MSRSLRVLALVPYPRGYAPSQRFRIEQWSPGLRTYGVDVRLAPLLEYGLFHRLSTPGRPLPIMIGLLRATINRYRQVATLVPDYDLILLHREALVFGPAIIERIIARRKAMVFDFDDSIWLRNWNRVHPLAMWLKFPGKTRSIVRHARTVLAGNAYLADWARRYNADVHVVPSTIDTNAVCKRQKEHQQTDLPVIGWSGTTSTLRYLEFLVPLLTELARTRSFRLLVSCNGPPLRWPGLDVEWRTWSAAREFDDLLDMDIGVMPQPDEEWAKGKCGMKALLYMALGIPPVASRNGVLPEIIEHSRSGFLASNAAEWMDALIMLIDDWKLRAAVGHEARATVDERYSARVHVPRVARILRDVVACGRAS